MSYLLDTCILSKARKKNPTDQKLKAWLNKHPDSSYFISVLTLGEIEAGISKIDVKTKEQEKHKVALQEWLRSELIPRFEGRISSYLYRSTPCLGKNTRSSPKERETPSSRLWDDCSHCITPRFNCGD